MRKVGVATPSTKRPYPLGLGCPAGDIVARARDGRLSLRAIDVALARLNSGVVKQARSQLRPLLEEARELALASRLTRALARVKTLTKAATPDEVAARSRGRQLSREAIKGALDALVGLTDAQAIGLREALIAARTHLEWDRSVTEAVRHDLSTFGPGMHRTRRFAALRHQ